MSEARFPPGWDEQRGQRVLAHYEGQADHEVVAEDEASWWEKTTHTKMGVPADLVQAVRELIAKRRAG